MEYTDKEKQVLELMDRTDFKNLSKVDLLGFVSKLSELRPEVAKEVIAKFPELVSLIKATLPEYKLIVETIIESGDKSTEAVYSILDKNLDITDDSRKAFYEYANKIHSDLSKCLNKDEMPFEQRKEILDRELEILKMIDKKDTEIRQDEKNIRELADKKDIEKKNYNWRILSTASLVIMVSVGFAAATLTGGEFKIKLPNKN
ncbi:hypothetical protein [Thomasclavelia spiroformis]|uniref:hypothetical protein n=1 Tax=Thomasclavelia spiroformis TaxID=29348 RepID=UPI00241E4619|nr:hypothetical protein [Thomasclavelia spiroformis]